MRLKTIERNENGFTVGNSETRQLDFYGTVNADGTPHITLLTSLHLYDPDTLIWGEIAAGISKKNQKERNRVGFLSLIDGIETVTGKAEWKKAVKFGEEFDAINLQPQYRYNTTNSASPVHVLKLVCLEEKALDKNAISEVSEKTRENASSIQPGSHKEAVSVCTREYFDAENGFKVLCYIGKEGYPVLLPVPQAELTSGGRVYFALDSFLDEIPDGERVAVYAVDCTTCCAVLVYGTLKKREDGMGIVEITKVYNPMLSISRFIYPADEYKTVTEFSGTLYEYNV